MTEYSPRSSAALVRLAIQKLTPLVGGRGKNINDDIKALVSKGPSVMVQQALDVCRVVGNNAVHPGEMDDTPEVTQSLFRLINIIVEEMITEPKEIEIYSSLPEGARDAIIREIRRRLNQAMQRTAGGSAFPLCMTSTFNLQRRALASGR